MDRQPEILWAGALRFFGEMSAANAHEIKNALAVINENAGLLEDLVQLAAKGTPLDPARLKRLAGAIRYQVARADHIARSSNLFSHSVDREAATANLEQALAIVADMATRFANLRDVRLRVEAAPAPITMQVRQFALLHLLWICLHTAIKTCTAGKQLTLTGCRRKERVVVHFGPLDDVGESLLSELMDLPETGDLLGSMGGTLGTDPQASALVLSFNKKKEPIVIA